MASTQVTFSPPPRSSGVNDAPQTQAASFSKGRVYVVFGPPGAGKGTQCKMLADKFGFVHISTGDVFRDLCERETELGLQAKEFLQKGCFVPDEFVLSLIRDRLSQPDVKERGCLLDGFPRTHDQAEVLLKLVKVDGVVALHVPEKTLIRRVADRRIDPETGDIYHLKHIPPPPEIASRLVCRDRDDERSFQQRIAVFKGQSRRVLPHFSGQVWNIEGTLEPADVFQSIVRCLEKATAEVDSKVVAAQGGHCSICFDEPANFLVVPCGHQCGCEECLKAVQRHSGRCPICRSPVQSIQRVFQCGRDDEAEATAPIAKTPTQKDLQEKKLDDQLDPTWQQQGEGDEWSEDGDDDDQEQQEAQAVTISLEPCEDVSEAGSEVDVAVGVSVPDSTQRVPVDVCCVVDVSGSMGSRATYEAEDGTVKDDGLTVLDIVKHAVKTVLKALKDGDRLALVAFNEKAHTALELTEMTESGQDKALEALEGLRQGGQTNIWAGLLSSMEALRAGGGAGRLQATLLLTDGQPNVNPPRGHLAELRDYKDTHPDFSFQLNTFGFGYSLDSELLLDLAKAGHGTYAFIPDAVIVGTTFVNSVANVLSTFAQTSTLSLMPRRGAELVGPVSGGLDELQESWGRAITLGPLQHGQARDLVVKVRVPAKSEEPYLDAVLTYATPCSASGRATAEGTGRSASVDALVARSRADTVSTGYDAISAAVKNKGKEAGEAVKGLCQRVEAAEAKSAADGRLASLKADVGGRMSKALQGKERFNRWGKHYLRALVRSHQLQVCTNFMDPGLQAYGGTLFRELREQGDRIFLSLPPPQPAKPPTPVAYTGGATTRAPSPAPNMNTYYAGAGGGCFAPSSSVARVNPRGPDTAVRLEAVRAGDHLRVADGGSARVRCVVRVARAPSKGLIQLPGGLRITPGHPVFFDDRWQLPRTMASGVPAPNDAGCVYNVVLDRCHVLPVDGVACATWGHGLQGERIGHAFFGTQRVVDCLAALEGWDVGFVDVWGTLRDADGQVVGFWSPAGAALAQGLPGHLEGAQAMGGNAICDEISIATDVVGRQMDAATIDSSSTPKHLFGELQRASRSNGPSATSAF